MFAALPSSSLFPPAVALHAVAFFAFFVNANAFRDRIFPRKPSLLRSFELVVVVALSFPAAFKRAAAAAAEDDARKDENLLLFFAFRARTRAGGDEGGGETRPASRRDMSFFLFTSFEERKTEELFPKLSHSLFGTRKARTERERHTRASL